MPTTGPPPARDLADWFYISGATLIGASVALLAAILAFKSVMRQIKASTSALKAQLRASAGNTRRQIAASREDVERQIAANREDVERQITANREDVERQIAGNREDVMAEIAAEDTRRKRQERMEVLASGVELVHQIHQWATKGGRRATDAAKEERQTLELKFQIFIARLGLVGMDDEALVMNSFWSEAVRSAEPGAVTSNEALLQKYLETLRVFKAAISV
ncbi:hypothetical protein ACQI4L_28585 [Mycolicibacterium litorale]|uniref:hypothetical protein n=1 Tax=Mycolicibacterium litorale TaxID=758802 RepID=UPI003CEB7FC3